MKKKLLILTMILFVLINVTSFADTEIPLPSGLRQYHIVLYVTYNGKYMLVTSNKPFLYDEYKNQIITYQNGEVVVYWAEPNGSEYTYTYTGTDFGRNINEFNVIASNHDIYYGTRLEIGTSVFFSGPPQPTQLRAVMEEMDFGMILRTFSAGLIPLIGLILLVISLHKGWGFLRNQLMH